MAVWAAQGQARGLIVGRIEEQEAIAAALEGAAAGQPSVVWVEGEPGFGKTALVRDEPSSRCRRGCTCARRSGRRARL